MQMGMILNSVLIVYNVTLSNLHMTGSNLASSISFDLAKTNLRKLVNFIKKVKQALDSPH